MKAHIFTAVLLLFTISCHKDTINNTIPSPHKAQTVEIALDEMANIFSCLPITNEQVQEVYNAVSSSSSNGYDEEYMLKTLIEDPGAGVGEAKTKGDGSIIKQEYKNPLRNLLKDYFSKNKTRAGMSVDDYLAYLSKSNMQIYWPYYDKWDGKTMPIITFDPENSNDSTNIGYQLIEVNGEKQIKEVEVTENLAKTTPVWVFNRNDDCQYTSLEIHRRNDPKWGKGGGKVTITPSRGGEVATNTNKTLVLKKIKALRNYDSWFAGASEFFIKCGTVENFTASTEEELKLYNPVITDFMLIIKRGQVKTWVDLNIVLVSSWTLQLDDCAFMVVEDDGGTQTKWEAETTVKYNSKSYGFYCKLPYKSKDDIVWRGALSNMFLAKNNNIANRFGDIELVFGFITQ